MNPNARPFTFSSGAAAFTPGGAAPAAAQTGGVPQQQQQQPNYYAQQGGVAQPNYYAQQQQQNYYAQQQVPFAAPQQQQQQQQQNYYQQQQYQQPQQQQYAQQQYTQQPFAAPQQQQQPAQTQPQRSPTNQSNASASSSNALPKASAAASITKPAAVKAPATAGLSTAKSTISFVSNKPAAASSSSTGASSSPAPSSDNWEALADKEIADAKASSPSPAPTTATPTKPTVDAAASSSSSSSSVAAASSPTTADLAKGVANIALDAEEQKELQEAEEEERRKKTQVTMAYAERKAHDDREHVNIVFIGHVDAGKSTISGQVLLLTGQVDERTIQKYEKEAKEKNRESWYLAYVMDTNEEERAKGKTVEVGRAHFNTAKKRYTLLDAPGHKNYVPNMIGGASQADVGVLVISARRGEFETGFDRGGQTREHAMLAKTLGLHRLIILVNKMDDPTVKWEQSRFDEIEGKLTPFLKKTGFNMSKDVTYIPASGFTGANIRDAVTEEVCPWVKDRRSLFQVLDDMAPLARDATGGLRLPIQARYKDMGALFVLGKLESGTLVKDSKLLMMPNRIEVQCLGIIVDEMEVDVAKPGENVIVKIKGIEEEDVQEGFVISYPDRPCRRAAVFEGQVAVLDLLEHKPILTVGYSCILHVHALAVECQVTHLVSEIDKKTGEPLPVKPRFLKTGAFANVRIKMDQSIAVEAFKDFQALGRFTLRDEGKTIAIGKILRMKDE